MSQETVVDPIELDPIDAALALRVASLQTELAHERDLVQEGECKLLLMEVAAEKSAKKIRELEAEVRRLVQASAPKPKDRLTQLAEDMGLAPRPWAPRPIDNPNKLPMPQGDVFTAVTGQKARETVMAQHGSLESAIAGRICAGRARFVPSPRSAGIVRRLRAEREALAESEARDAVNE